MVQLVELLFPNYGSYKGFLDDLRIYDRGFDAGEVAEIFEGDYTNNGYLDFLAIDKPDIITKSAIDVSPGGQPYGSKFLVLVEISKRKAIKFF